MRSYLHVEDPKLSLLFKQISLLAEHQREKGTLAAWASHILAHLKISLSALHYFPNKILIFQVHQANLKER
jgi:hypothetical protein